VNGLIVTLGSAASDPRTSLLTNSLQKSSLLIGTLEIQSYTPRTYEVLNTKTGSVTRSDDSQLPYRWSSWVSRKVARDALREFTLRGKNEVASLVLDLNSHCATPTEHFHFNQISIAYFGLKEFLEFNTVSHPVLIFAEDFYCALAATILAPDFNSSVCYDGHELFAEAIQLFGGDVSSEFMTILRDLERYVWNEVDLMVSVSPGISNFISQETNGRRVFSVPNFSSLTSAVSLTKSAHSTPLRFAYFGGAAPFRNVDKLAAIWPRKEGSATLHLFMPASPWADDVREIARENSNIEICTPITPSNLIQEMSKFDVGVIPYAYPYPYDNASPNKFGEYLAAGLPMVVHPQIFTSQLIDQFKIGVNCDCTSADALTTAINDLSFEKYTMLKENVNQAFLQSLNWECVVKDFLDEIVLLKDKGSPNLDSTNHSQALTRKVRLTIICDLLFEKTRPLLKVLGQLVQQLHLGFIVPNRLIRRIS
jgi:glycosyltransferase involved in cell wall biosynthesis